MNKKIISLVTLATLMVAMAVTSFAATDNKTSYNTTNTQYRGYSSNIEKNKVDDFLTQDEFEENIDKAIAEGYISSEDKDYYLNMFEYCFSNREDSGRRGRGCGNRGGNRFNN